VQQKYTIYVMQAGLNKKDVYVAQTTEEPYVQVELFNSNPNPKALPKPLGKMRPLILRPELAGENTVFYSQNDAIQARKNLSEILLSNGYNLLSKRPFFFGKKKSIKDKQTGKHKLVIDPSQQDVNDTRVRNPSANEKDAFSYGRKKSIEWNDEVAAKFEEAIKQKVQQRHNDVSDT